MCIKELMAFKSSCTTFMTKNELPLMTQFCPKHHHHPSQAPF